MAERSGRATAWSSERPTIRWGAYAWALVGFLLAFALLWRGLGYVRIVLVPLSLALFPAAVLTPVAAWLEEKGWPPALAAFTLVALFLLLLLSILTVMGMQIQTELSGLVDQLERGYTQLQEQFGFLSVLPPPDQLFNGLTGGSGSGSGSSSGGSGNDTAKAALSALQRLAEFATQFFLFLVASFFFLKDREAIATWLDDQFPDDRKEDAAEVGTRMWQTVSSYVRGQTIIAAFDGVFVALGLFIVGVPLAIVLGGLVFFGAFIPVVGSITAGAIAVVVALATKGLVAALITLAIVVGVQQLEGNVLAPYILGRELSLHPLVILVAITVGAVVLGAWGALIAVPLTASAHRFGSYVKNHHRTPDDPAVEPAG